MAKESTRAALNRQRFAGLATACHMLAEHSQPMDRDRISRDTTALPRPETT